MPLVKSFTLSTKKNKRVWLDPIVDRQEMTVRFVLRSEGTPPTKGTINRGSATCIFCNEGYSQSILREQVNKTGFEDPIPLAMYVQSGSQRSFRPIGDMPRETAVAADMPYLGEIIEASQYMGPRNYGFTDYSELFTPRHMRALLTFSELVTEARELVIEHSGGDTEYADAIATYLGLTVSRLSAHSSTACIWWSTSLILIQAFAGQGLPMTWDYAETNPLEGMVNWETALRWVTEGILGTNPRAGGYVGMLDAAETFPYTKAQPFVVTDPPYYNNVPYADLSDFFYVWLRRSLRSVYPDLLGTIVTPKVDEMVATPYHFDGDQEKAKEHFESRLQQSFSQILKNAHPDLPFILYYAFRQAEEEGPTGDVASTGWETMLEALIQTGYQITATWPIRTETQGGLRHYGRNSLASSIIIVCRPRLKNALITSRREFVAMLREQLPSALHDLQDGEIAPVDLAQASIGPGMAVYSRYAQVLEPNGDRLTVRTALQLINQVLDEFLAETEGDVDADTRFAVDWFKQYGFQPGPFGTADVLARAKNTSVQGLQDAGVLTSSAGKVQLLAWEQLDAGWDPTTDRRPTAWEATHHLIERLNTHGEAGAALLLAKMPADLAAAARQLAYRLYSICERKGWAEQARDYNALVVSWSESQERAAAVKGVGQQGRLFGE
jgi:putative DNA methylase